ncbi:protein cycle-like isoform X2 [Tigriopus californicus]|uniref:protein cycle-like isoform X2 n=1 Tax=Tigriopus californicus TaxID=6832 RepID=UPI0027D9F402|nr:protein cycle-like isoform X2 [Tigriopus californicus]
MGKKRKDMDEMSNYSEDGTVASGPARKPLRLSPSEEQKKYVRQNHSEIEKRRRDKMNTYITELSCMIPTCVAMSRKMDKLTVLRLAVQHLKSLRGSLTSFTEGLYKPPMLTEQELKQLILQSADGFLFVVDSARGRMLYVSESVNQVLNYSQGDLFGQSLFDILHPKDIAKVKEQMSSSDITPRERLIDSKTMLPVKGAAAAASASQVPPTLGRLCPGARRSFYCRMKAKCNSIKEELPPETSPNATPSSSRRYKKSHPGDKKYVVIQCTGYLKSWALTKMGTGVTEELNDPESQDSNPCMSCLVAVGRLKPSLDEAIKDSVDMGFRHVPGVEFTARLTVDGFISYVDQRVTTVLGYLPQELVGTSIYGYVQPTDLSVIEQCHRKALTFKEEVKTTRFRFRSKDGEFFCLEASWRQFRNPWNKEIEYIVSKYFFCVANDEDSGQESSQMISNMTDPSVHQNSYGSSGGDINFFSDPGRSQSRSSHVSTDFQKAITSHADAAKIGRQIAEELQSRNCNSDSSSNSPISRLVQNSSPNDFNNPSSIPPPVGGPYSAETSNQANPSLMQEALEAVKEEQLMASNPPSVMSMGLSSGMNRGMSPGPPMGGVRNQSCDSAGEEVCTPTMLNSGTDSSSEMDRGPKEGGNDEAAMAVIMSLLEADAGLGGPVDFSGLPWPLP